MTRFTIVGRYAGQVAEHRIQETWNADAGQSRRPRGSSPAGRTATGAGTELFLHASHEGVQEGLWAAGAEGDTRKASCVFPPIAAPSGSSGEGEDEQPRQPKRVLVVDDEPQILRHMTRVLGRAGYDAIAVQDAAECIAAARQTSPDLVILDLWFTGITGFELFEQLRQFSDAPVIFLSAAAQEADREQALSMGAEDYMVKPVSVADLLERVQAALQRR